MLGIKNNYNDVDWKNIEELHLKYCYKIINSKIKCYGRTKRGRYFKSIYNFVERIIEKKEEIKLEDIILCKPESINNLNDHLKNKISHLRNNEKIKKTIKHIFDYDTFVRDKREIGEPKGDSVKWGAYYLSNKLNIRVCPYCNRQYTTTVVKREESNIQYIIRPEFDHFYARSKYPFFGLSLYNLVPSCHICNSNKSDNELLTEVGINPYISGFGDDFKFSYTFSKNNSFKDLLSEERLEINYHLSGSDTHKIENNIQLFKLKEIYNQSHRDIVSELLQKQRKHSMSYIEFVEKFVGERNISKQEIYRLAFCNYYKDRELGNRPLSKLTRDIVEELGLVEGFLDKDDR